MRSPDDEMLTLPADELRELYDCIYNLRDALEDQRALAALWMRRYTSCRRALIVALMAYALGWAAALLIWR